MARALLSTLAGAAWLASSAAADSYQVVQTYDASNFFDSFNFWEVRNKLFSVLRGVAANYVTVP